MDKNKILNSLSVVFQNVFNYFNQLEEEQAKQEAIDKAESLSCKLRIGDKHEQK